jgi:plasmid stability protein
MPTLYVENVPTELYEALRARALERRSSISAEVLALIAENMPTPSEIARRRELLDRARRLRSKRSGGRGPFPATEEMQREDRRR